MGRFNDYVRDIFLNPIVALYSCSVERECVICQNPFAPRRSVDKTCSMDCQIVWRRKLSRESSARHYQKRPTRPDSKCEGCETPIAAPRSGPLAKWCDPCKAKREHIRASKRLSIRRCYKCQTPLPEAARQPGKAVCENCRVDPRDRGREHEQRRRLRKYGLTQQQYDQMLEQQGDRCKVCRTDYPGVRGWCIDHSHSSGEVRGLLCMRCNTMLGLANEDPAILRMLADFLDQLESDQSEIKI